MIKGIIKKLLKPAVDQLYHRLNKYDYLGGSYVCPVCGNSIKYFNRLPDSIFEELDKHQFVHSSFYSETMNALKYTCPRCKASDRDRLYALYVNERLSSMPSDRLKLLDIAPSKALRAFLLKKNIEYRSADLFMEGVDDKVDVTDMKLYMDGRFDIFICSHVLEHVKEDIKAMKEFYRVLNRKGWGIMMVPILLSLEGDLEQDHIRSEGDRWKYYGQNDHVRMYSKKGFVSKLEGVGFKVSQFGVDHFGEKQFDQAGIHRRSILYVVEK